MNFKKYLTIFVSVLTFFICSDFIYAQNCISGDCVNGKGTIDYGNRKYEGEFKNGKRDGEGVMTWQNGGTYKGSWKEDNRVEGVETFVNGCRYEGPYLNNKRNGKGKFFWSGSDARAAYDGEWLNDKMNGNGVMTWKNGIVYTGTWKDDSKVWGVETYPNVGRYEGSFKGYAHDGKGKFIWLDGSIYEGDWRNEKMNGRGVKTWPDGQRYDGEWQDDLFSGRGTYTWPDKQYTGNWYNGSPNGQGFLKTKDGLTYNGSWKDGNKHGYGTLIREDGTKYVGEFINGVYHGNGTLYSSNGNIINSGLWEGGFFIGNKQIEKKQPIEQAGKQPDSVKKEVLKKKSFETSGSVEMGGIRYSNNFFARVEVEYEESEFAWGITYKYIRAVYITDYKLCSPEVERNVKWINLGGKQQLMKVDSQYRFNRNNPLYSGSIIGHKVWLEFPGYMD